MDDHYTYTGGGSGKIMVLSYSHDGCASTGELYGPVCVRECACVCVCVWILMGGEEIAQERMLIEEVCGLRFFIPELLMITGGW